MVRGYSGAACRSRIHPPPLVLPAWLLAASQSELDKKKASILKAESKPLKSILDICDLQVSGTKVKEGAASRSLHCVVVQEAASPVRSTRIVLGGYQPTHEYI